MTPLLDATGAFITKIGQDLSELEDNHRPGLVICVIMTDGMENASREWTWDSVQALIKQQSKVYQLEVHVLRRQHERGQGGWGHGYRP